MDYSLYYIKSAVRIIKNIGRYYENRDFELIYAADNKSASGKLYQDV